ncbi:hypothetical protein B5P44_01180 [Mycobacterium sp. CBMA 213]|uniref:Uncharacterized protein n=1 Tax=Mycolicibacterium sp. CBMA 213 TaxID=1968788 RepID=A0A343VRM9_9MYCO|nr:MULTISPECIES: hypothetical protein [unclassified Mycolicibacterium]AVN58553.1 hypothetical protein B5P44_p00258 [Mycolicibacterium sp. CBMA 213]MUL61195.1 hypothetical protein [Mycolicibacterium sp. CBMA 335]MUM03433.1 hypothetical protein [Mycolicibacterium sp. CBMA 213]
MSHPSRVVFDAPPEAQPPQLYCVGRPKTQPHPEPRDVAFRQIRIGRNRVMTRLQWRGWRVDISDDNRAVTVPRQHGANGPIEELSALMAFAYDRIGVQVTPGSGTSAEVLANADPVHVEDAIALLEATWRIVERRWPQRRSLNIYTCLNEAWEQDEMLVPPVIPLAALRAALPEGKLLCDYTARHSPQTAKALFGGAIALLRRRRQLGGAA